MKRLDQEYMDYKVYTAQNMIHIFDHPEELLNMKYAYDYLRSQEIPDAELAYLMQAMKPIHTLAEMKELHNMTEHSPELTAVTSNIIYDGKMLDQGDVELYTDRVPIRFHKNMGSIDAIRSLPRNREDDTFKIEHIVEMSPRDFSAYADDLFAELPFIKKHDQLMYIDYDRTWHCILVCDAQNSQGLLICAEGYEYARYTAYVENTHELDLRNLSVERYISPKGRNRTISKPSKAPER